MTAWLFGADRAGRPLDAAIAALVARQWPDTPAHILQALAIASLATSQGHTAIDVAELAAMSAPSADASVDDWIAALRRCPAVGDATNRQAFFVLDQGRLYLQRFHAAEVRLAKRLVEMTQPAHVSAGTGEVASAMATLFPGLTDPAADRQTLACLMSLSARLTVVLGGPGTGKTTTVMRLLALHQRLAHGSLDIAVAAPTGKAAARVAEAMQAASERLRLDAESKAELPMHAQTIHRLLGAHADGVRFRYGRDRRLSHDLVVIDEASMIDLTTFVRLVDALRDDARLILLGDPDQLEAIESGSVLAELATFDHGEPSSVAVNHGRSWMRNGAPAVRDVAPPSISDCVVRLTGSWRFGQHGGIAELAAAVRSGDGAAMRDALSAGYDDLVHLETSDEGTIRAVREFACDRYVSALASREPAAMLAAHAAFRVLVATRVDSARINAVAADALGQRLRADIPEAGLPFLIERNDPLRNLRNGDTGVFAMDEQGGVRACLSMEGCLPSQQISMLSPYEIGAWLPAYAMTVHRAQGSEYDDVMVVLPALDNTKITRSWLYTAISRARRRLVIVGRLSALQSCLERSQQRESALAERLSDQAIKIGASELTT